MERPQAVTAFGILNIVFGAIGVIGILIALVHAKALSANPAVAAMYSSPAYMTWSNIYTPIGGVLSAALVAAGIGLLKLKPWARTASIGCGVVMIVAACVNSFMYSKFVLPSLLEKAASLLGSQAMVLKFTGYFTACVGPAGLIYPALLLFFMTRSHVRDAFAPRS